MKWIEVSIRTTTEAVEAVANVLYDAGVSGVVIEDPNDIIFVNNDEKTWDFVDESLIDLEQGALVKGYLPESSDLIEKVDLIKDSIAGLPEFGLDIGSGEVSTLEVNDEDWSTSWKKYYKPTKIGNRMVIKPTWEEYEPQEEEIIIEMDPGMAFGTGTHETTAMCVEQLEKRITKDSTVFDIGTGSGILSVVAAKLGAKKVIGVDFDEVAVNVANENALENKVENIVEIKHGNLMDVVTEKADIVVANIIAEVIIILSKDIKKFLNKDGLFISSGIILDKMDSVKESLVENGLEVIEVETMGEWVAIVSKVKGE